MYYIDEIDNSNLVSLFEFLFNRSKKVSFKRLYQRGVIENLELNEKNQKKYYEIGFIEKNDFDKQQDTMKKAIQDYCKGNCENGCFASEEEMRKCYEEELETMMWYIDYDKEIKNKKDLSFKGETNEYLGKEITRCSYDTIGGFQEICYFIIGNIVKNIIHQMNNLYDWKKFNICNEQFYGFACWRNDEEVIFFTMPGDKIAVMNLTNDEYEELLKLNLGIKLRS